MSGKMRITITGGFGYIGSSCADYFQKKGHDVTIFARKIPEFLSDWSENFTVVLGDITGPKINFDSDIVVHCASVNETKDMSLEEFVRINCGGTKNAIESCIGSSVEKFIRISTFHAYGNKAGVITEDTKPEPHTKYGISHMLSDKTCMDYSDRINVTVLRFSNVFGQPVHPNIDRWSLVVNNFCMQAVKTGKIVLNSKGNQRRDFVALSDAISSTELIVKSQTDSGEIFNVGSGHTMSIMEVASKVAKNYEVKYGNKIDLVIGDKDETCNDFIFSIDKIKRLGYKPGANMDSAIRQMFGMCELL